MDIPERATRLGLALALGFVIGLERGIFGILSLGGDRTLISAGAGVATVSLMPQREAGS
jgi:hypothetical protein